MGAVAVASRRRRLLGAGAVAGVRKSLHGIARKRLWDPQRWDEVR